MTDIQQYHEFLKQKEQVDLQDGFIVEKLHSPYHFPFQEAITRWALAKGKCLLAEECGLGKGLQILEWCHQVSIHTQKPVILFAPPGVKLQFKYEAQKFGFDVNIIAEQEDVKDGINITNYERIIKRETILASKWEQYQQDYVDYFPIEIKRTPDQIEVERFRFNPLCFGGIALDEGSILKHYGSKTRERLTRFAQDLRFRLVATATPAPNDYPELLNYAEFLGIMTWNQARAKYLIQDGQTSNRFRIKRPAWHKFWKWIASWAVMIRYPSDLGYDDKMNGTSFILPKWTEYSYVIDDTFIPSGEMFPRPPAGIQEENQLKARTVEERCQVAADLANGKELEVFNETKKHIEKVSIPTSERVVVWCRRNNEGLLLNKLIPDSIEVAGRHDEEYKEKSLIDFIQGRGPRVLITKPDIGGLGLNMQICHYAIEVNIDHSYEEQHQADRRILRFLQESDVSFFRISMSTEGNITQNRNRKRKQTDIMYQQIVKEMKIHELQQLKTRKEIDDYMSDYRVSDKLVDDKPFWELWLGDSVENVKELDNQSVGQVITSIPFPAMYVYTNSPRDIGNYDDIQELLNHSSYVFTNLLPKMIPGRLVEIHISQAVAHLNREGFIGLQDFRGPLIQMMTDCGYDWHGEITIEKDPQTERARSNTLGLAQKTLGKDAIHMRSSVSDYVLQFRAPGTNPYPIKALLADPEISGNYNSPDGWITLEMWINWASNVWYKYRKGMKWWEGINVTNVCGAGKGELGIRDARGKDDEKHLCELQLDVIERLVALHSNPGDLIVDPFNGIGSTGFQCMQMGRRYWGSELKESYFDVSVKNLTHVATSLGQVDMFSQFGIDLAQSCLGIHQQWMTKRGINLDVNSSKVIRATNWSQWESLIEYMSNGGLI